MCLDQIPLHVNTIITKEELLQMYNCLLIPDIWRKRVIWKRAHLNHCWSDIWLYYLVIMWWLKKSVEAREPWQRQVTTVNPWQDCEPTRLDRIPTALPHKQSALTSALAGRRERCCTTGVCSFCVRAGVSVMVGYLFLAPLPIHTALKCLRASR